MRGEIDGIPLGRFQVGQTYDLPASLGTYMMVSGWATAVTEMGPAMRIPLDDVESISLAAKIRESVKARQKTEKER